MTRAILVLLAPLILSACAQTLAACAPASTLPLASLRCAAAKGDKLAQVRLGMAHESGVGVEQDFAMAARLYRRAAAPVSGTTYVYSAPVGGEKYGRVIPVRTGADQPGLPLAKVRLARLHIIGLGVEANREEAIELLRDATAAGNAEAKRLLFDLGQPSAAAPQ